MARNKAVASHGEDLTSTIADIEASAKAPVERQQRKAVQAPAAEPSRSMPGRHPEHTSRILAAGASHQQRIENQKRLEAEARTGRYSDGKGPDAIKLRLSAQTLGDFIAPAKSIGFDIARLSALDPYQLQTARAAHRRFRESGGDREHLISFMRELGDGSTN